MIDDLNDYSKWLNANCLDPERPSWLPFFIATPGEMACKIGLYPNNSDVDTLPAPPAPHISAPQTVDDMTKPGLWDPDRSATQTRVDFIDSVTDQIRAWEEDIASKPVNWWPWLLAGGLALGTLVVLTAPEDITILTAGYALGGGRKRSKRRRNRGIR